MKKNPSQLGFRVSLEGISDNVIPAQAGIYNPLIGYTGVTKKHLLEMLWKYVQEYKKKNALGHFDSGHTERGYIKI